MNYLSLVSLNSFLNRSLTLSVDFVLPEGVVDVVGTVTPATEPDLVEDSTDADAEVVKLLLRNFHFRSSSNKLFLTSSLLAANTVDQSGIYGLAL